MMGIYLPMVRLMVLTNQMASNVTATKLQKNTQDTGGSRGAYENWCYSCMSPSYEVNWNVLQAVYYRPKDVTPRCEEPFQARGIRMDKCKSICVTLKEPELKGGMKVGTMYMRGCIDRILINGFNESAIATHAFWYKDECRTLDRQQLMKTIPGRYMYGMVSICTCLGNKCNHATTIFTHSTTLTNLIIAIVFVIINSVVRYRRL